MPLADLGVRLAAPALANTFLTRFPGDARDALLATGTIVEIPHRQVIFGSSDRPRVGFLLEGLARVYLSARTGRRLTVRYGRAGDILGNIAGAPGVRAPLSAAAVTDCVLVEIEMETLLGLVETEVASQYLGGVGAHLAPPRLERRRAGVFDQRETPVRSQR